MGGSSQRGGGWVWWYGGGGGGARKWKLHNHNTKTGWEGREGWGGGQGVCRTATDGARKWKLHNHNTKKLEYDAGRKEHRFYTVILSVIFFCGGGGGGGGVCIIHTPSQDIHISLNTLFPFPKKYTERVPVNWICGNKLVQKYTKYANTKRLQMCIPNK